MTKVTAKAKCKTERRSNMMLKAINIAAATCVTQLTNADYLLPFGPALNNEDKLLVAESLIAHRFVNKWHIPDKRRDAELKVQCEADWIAHEEKISRFVFRERSYSCFMPAMPADVGPCRPVFNYTPASLNANHRKAMVNIRNWLRPVNYQLRAWDQYDVDKFGDRSFLDLDFTPGESFVSSKGLTSVRQKLMSSEWTVTTDLIEWSLKVTLTHRALREAAVLRLRMDKVRHHDAWNNRVDTAVVAGRITYDQWIALNVRKYLFVIVEGARASSVEKNNLKRRFINIEPLFNMIYQRGVGLIIRDALSLVGNDLEVGQDAHRKFIRSMLYVTLDLRNASDSNIYVAARALLQDSSPELWTAIDRSRSKTTTFFTSDGKERVEVNCKLSSMGNGFTFEVMTLLLLAQARVYDACSRVYGDDIIMRRCSDVHGYIDQISITGWELNLNKSFIDSHFYESCGGFVHNGEDLVSYDINPILNLADVIVTANKVRLCIEYLGSLPNGSGSLVHKALSDFHATIWANLPSGSKGPIRSLLTPSFNKMIGFNGEYTFNCDYAEGPNWRKAHQGNESLRTRFIKHLPRARELKFIGMYTRLPVAIIDIPRFKSSVILRGGLEVQCPFQKLFYLFANRITDDTIRGKGRWSTVTCYVFEDGYVLPVASAKRYLEAFKRANQVGPKPYSYNTAYNDARSTERAQLWNSTWDMDWFYNV